jgi:hypothetical protein
MYDIGNGIAHFSGEKLTLLFVDSEVHHDAC